MLAIKVLAEERPLLFHILSYFALHTKITQRYPMIQNWRFSMNWLIFLRNVMWNLYLLMIKKLNEQNKEIQGYYFLLKALWKRPLNFFHKIPTSNSWIWYSDMLLQFQLVHTLQYFLLIYFYTIMNEHGFAN